MKKDEKERLKKWRTFIDRVMDSTREDREEMDRYLKRFTGEWWAKDKDQADSDVFANFIFSTVMTIAPMLTDNRPQWSVRARLPFFQNYMNAWKLNGDYFWDKEGLDQKCLDVVIDALLMKVGLAMIAFDPEAEQSGEVRFEVVDPRTFWIAPGYSDLWEAPSCGTRERRPLAWIREKFPETGKDVKSDEEGKDSVLDDKEPFELQDLYSTVYTTWCKDSETEDYYVNAEGDEVAKGDDTEKKSRAKYPNGRFLYFTPDTWLGDRPSPYKHGKPPYVAFYDYRIPHQFLGGGECEQIENLNKSFNRCLQLADRHNTFYSDPPQFVDANAGVEIEKYKAEYKAGGGVFMWNPMQAVNKDTPVTVTPIKPMNRVTFELMTGLTRLFEEITGVVDVTKGMASKGERQSATEIGSLVESAYTRTRQRIRNFEFFLKRCFYLIISTQQQFYDDLRFFSYRNTAEGNGISWEQISNSKNTAERMVAPNRGEEGSEAEDKDWEQFMDYAKGLGDFDPIYAAFDIEIQSNSTLPMDKQSLANLFLRLLQMAGSNPVTAMPMWKAALENLHIPRYKEIIAEMEQLFTQSMQGGGTQQEQMQGPPPPMMDILQGGQGL